MNNEKKRIFKKSGDSFPVSFWKTVMILNKIRGTKLFYDVLKKEWIFILRMNIIKNRQIWK